MKFIVIPSVVFIFLIITWLIIMVKRAINIDEQELNDFYENGSKKRQQKN